MTTIAHLVRPHLFASEQSYTLEPDALLVKIKGKTTSIPYSDIKSVRILTYANFGGTHCQCTVKTHSHGKLVIRSHSYASLGDFEDRTGTYFPFVAELCRRVHEKNPQAQFITGSGWIQTLWLVVLILSIGGWIIFALILLGGGADLQSSATFVFFLIFITSISFHWVRRNKPELFDPLNPPFVESN